MKVEPFDVKSNTYIGFNVEPNNGAHPKFKVGDHVRISKCKEIFAGLHFELVRRRICD